MGMGRWAFVLALPLAFISHYVLDAIPHFEGVKVVQEYKSDLLLIACVGLVGIVAGVVLMKFNRDAGRILLVFSLWAGTRAYTFSWLRVVTAALAVGYMVYATRRWLPVAYLLVGMAAISPDLIPRSFYTMSAVHNSFHYHTDVGTYLYNTFVGTDLPSLGLERLYNPYFVAGYLIEILGEVILFLGCWRLLLHEKFAQAITPPVEAPQTLAVQEEN